MEVKHFTDLKIWQKSHQLFIDLLEDVKQLPKHVSAQIVTSQIVRSVGAISANIAEGFNAASTREYMHYLDIARRTAAESENWFYKLKDAGWMQEKVSVERIESCIEIAKMTNSLRKKLTVRK